MDGPGACNVVIEGSPAEPNGPTFMLRNTDFHPVMDRVALIVSVECAARE
jgi:hypothetical protein